jgi:hypothetical protein
MAANKHSKRTTANKTTGGRQTKHATSTAVPHETPTPAELAPVETAEAASAPTAETKTADTPTPAEGETIAPDPTPPDAPAPVKKLSAVDAAARVLGESGQAMNCPELIAAMAAQGYWSSPRGRTPAGTLYSAVLRELQTKGDQARFRKTARGKFALRQTE